MHPTKLNKYLEANKNKIRRIVLTLLKRNPDYSLEEIHSMVVTTIWDSSNEEPTQKEIYLNTLNRILEEKGLTYNQGELSSIFTRVEEPSHIENIGDFDAPEQKPHELLDDIFEKSDLTQDEVFVTALSYNMSTPNCLKGKYKDILDNIEGIYYIRKLTKKEIADIMQVSIKEVTKLRNEALEKMEKYCEAQGLHWARKDKN